MKYVVSTLLTLLLAISVASADSLTIRPDSQGARAEWRNVGCSSGVNEWQCVDEAVPDTSDYLRTGGNRRETFNFEDTGLTTETIDSVTIYYYAMQHRHSGNSCFQAMVRDGGVEYFTGTQMCVGSSWEYVNHEYTTNPATGLAWTVAEVDDLEAGMQGLNPNNGGRVAQVYVVVEYQTNETNQTNETAPDLTISYFDSFTINGTNSTNGSLVNISFGVSNIGDAVAGASTAEISVSSGSDFFSVPSLSPGATLYFSEVVECVAPSISVNTIADTHDVVAESDETNNEYGSVTISC